MSIHLAMSSAARKHTALLWMYTIKWNDNWQHDTIFPHRCQCQPARSPLAQPDINIVYHLKDVLNLYFIQAHSRIIMLIVKKICMLMPNLNNLAFVLFLILFYFSSLCYVRRAHTRTGAYLTRVWQLILHGLIDDSERERDTVLLPLMLMMMSPIMVVAYISNYFFGCKRFFWFSFFSQRLVAFYIYTPVWMREIRISK